MDRPTTWKPYTSPQTKFAGGINICGLFSLIKVWRTKPFFSCFEEHACLENCFKWKKDNKQWLDTPPPPSTEMVNKGNYYGEYKGMTFLHAHAHYICIVCAKYQKASVKALVQVDFPMYALSKNKHNPHLIGNRKKWLSSQSYHFVKNYYFGIKRLHTNVQCVYIV